MAEADLERSIPSSMVDGLKPGQRKVLFCSFKRNLIEETKVSHLAAYVSEHAAYHHGDQSLAGIIIGMAQDFVGSNNVSLLEPRGQFGTRCLGGEDAADAADIFTRLAPITRLIFSKDDDVLLDYLNEDGKSIEPSWYVPIIPMVLVNGTGIDNGSNSYVPNYNPRDIIANLKRLLNDETVVPMDPWYRGFKGSLKETSSKEAGVTYTITGVIEEVDDTMLKITELPIRCWTADYQEFLESMCPWWHDEDKEPPFLEGISSQCDDDDANVEFDVILSQQNMNVAKQEGLEKKFKLTSRVETTNMQLLDSDGKIRKYDTPEDILKDFFKLRLKFYGRRKEVMLDNIRKELLMPKNKVRFILAVISGDIIVNNRKRAELFLELKQKGYEPFPEEKITAEPVAVGATAVDEAAAGVNASEYEYLFAMTDGTLTPEKIQELIALHKNLEDKVESLCKTTPETLWLRDLAALEKELDVIDAKFEAEEQVRKKAALLKEQRWNTLVKSQKASAPVTDDEDEAFELKHRLLAYNLDGSLSRT
uniref:DNA topoisomerase (ATP-hydrolyzing) n=1 Tax=Triticum urartu TaxID=4572 RepID=A0A8R7UEI5_TRIUA